MRKIIINFFNYKGEQTNSIVSDWPHYRKDEFIWYNGAEYKIRYITMNIDEMIIYIRAIATGACQKC